MRQRMQKYRATIMAICLSAVAGGCRDGIAPFTPVIREPLDGDTYQLTYSSVRDFGPTWSANSDTVFYSTARFVDQPTLNGTLLRIARPGGIATLLAPGAVVNDTFPRTILPVPSPDRQRIAYVHIPFIKPVLECGLNAACFNTEPLLEPGSVRVRDVTSTGLALMDMGTAVTFAGNNDETNFPIERNQELFPFQRMYAERGLFAFRPSWSPDAGRIVFSDGLVLRIWDLASNVTTAVPNSFEGINAAWSPTSERIAFTRLTRGDSTSVTCFCTEVPDNDPVRHNRWVHTLTRSAITLIDPDGQNAVELAEGDDAAWSPDGAFIYFVANNVINRIPAAGGVAVPIPGTTGGRAPAVSPDGQWLAYTQASGDFRNSDIWITRLGAQ